MCQIEAEEIPSLAGLGRRAPLLALTMSLAMVSLAGIPPLAGFFGKFLLLKAVIAQAPAQHAYYWLIAVAIAGVVISLYYYFGVVRAIYWSDEPADPTPIKTSKPIRLTLAACITGMLLLGIYPNPFVELADQAVRSLH
jgi:NADH-quinone oxidoreductase subunit N